MVYFNDTFLGCEYYAARSNLNKTSYFLINCASFLSVGKMVFWGGVLFLLGHACSLVTYLSGRSKNREHAADPLQQ
jgi:hypothetical protein